MNEEDDPSETAPVEAEPARTSTHDKEYCPQCGRVLRAHRCKLVCECGYLMSCSEF